MCAAVLLGLPRAVVFAADERAGAFGVVVAVALSQAARGSPGAAVLVLLVLPGDSFSISIARPHCTKREKDS